MKALRTLLTLTCLSTLIFTSGCKAFTSWFEDDDPIKIDGEFQPATPEDGELNLNDPEFKNLNTSEWQDAKSFENAVAGNGDWTPVNADLGFPTIYFAYDQDRLGVSERVKLDAVANYLKDHTNLGLIVEGHCDERGSDEFNRALGERRAISVKDYLISAGVPAERVKTISFGEEKPADTRHSEEAYSKNRRGVLVPARMN
jgi:peptidoglycan-associated lipoprotein